MYQQPETKQHENIVNETITEEEIFEPVLGELIADDSFAFTLLSCHC